MGMSKVRPRLHAWTLDWWAGGQGTVGSVLDAALWPAERAFAAVAAGRNLAYDRGWIGGSRAPIPVISIGNLTVGGAGKTPFAAWVATTLAGWGRSPAIVLRGYGEDEVLVHRELNPDVPVFTARRRAEAAKAAAAAGRGVAILDDGFQHRALARDLDVVLVAAEAWSDRRRLLPRGPWRESITALRRAGVIVVTRKWAIADRSSEVAAELAARHPAAVVATCQMQPDGLTPLRSGLGACLDAETIRDLPALAVASIGDPHAFARQLEMMGADVDLMAFPDHHRFDVADARAIVERAARRTIVMTRKDAVKLRALLPAEAGALVLEQRVEVESGRAELLEALRRASSP